MMNVIEAKSVIEQIITDRGRGFDWLCYSRFRHSVSPEAKILATRVLSDNDDDLHTRLKLAIERELQSTVHWDWVARATALMLDDDSEGNHLTVEMLSNAKQYRLYLGMNY